MTRTFYRAVTSTKRSQGMIVRGLAIGLLLWIVGCTSATSTIKSATNLPSVDPDGARIGQVLSWLDGASHVARNLNAEGELTASNDETSQDAHFTLKSKRLSTPSKSDPNRVDSLSVEVTGPFGISVARLLASPDQYYFYNILNGDSFHGPTDAHSLEGLTQMKGLTLGMLDDALYGLPPGADRFSASDSIQLLSTDDDTHILFIRHLADNATDAIYFKGGLPAGNKPLTKSALTMTRFQRWSGILDVLPSTTPKPFITIRYDSPTMHDGILLPSSIETIAGQNRLTLEYSKVKANASDLTVKIKMPKS